MALRTYSQRRERYMPIYATIYLQESGPQGLPAEMDPDNEGTNYGLRLPGMADELDEIARHVGVRPISSFFDDSGMIDDDEREELGLPPAEPKWAPVAEGLRTVRALIAALVEAGADSERLWDLQASERILSAAAQEDLFHYNLL